MAISFSAGQLLTAAQMNLLCPVYVAKTADQSVTNSATDVNDNDIAIPLNAGQIVEVVLTLGVLATTKVPGIRVAWTAGGTLTVLDRSGSAPASPIGTGVANGAGAPQQSFQFIALTDVTYGVDSSLATRIEERLIIATGVSGGTLQLKWSQSAATAATTTTIKAGSYAVARYVS